MCIVSQDKLYTIVTMEISPWSQSAAVSIKRGSEAMSGTTLVQMWTSNLSILVPIWKESPLRLFSDAFGLDIPMLTKSCPLAVLLLNRLCTNAQKC